MKKEEAVCGCHTQCARYFFIKAYTSMEMKGKVSQDYEFMNLEYQPLEANNKHLINQIMGIIRTQKW